MRYEAAGCCKEIDMRRLVPEVQAFIEEQSFLRELAKRFHVVQARVERIDLELLNFTTRGGAADSGTMHWSKHAHIFLFDKMLHVIGEVGEETISTTDFRWGTVAKNEVPPLYFEAVHECITRHDV